MKKIFILFALFLACLHVDVLYGQETEKTDTLYRITVSDGNVFIGKIIDEDSIAIYLETSNLGQLKILHSDIKSSEDISNSKIVSGKIWDPVLQSTRYFFSPNGYGQRKGEVYYQNVMVLYNQVSVGVSDYFSIGGGIVPLFLFAGSPTPVWIVPKVSVPVVKDMVNVGAGAIIGGVIGAEESLFGLVYGVGTIGSRDLNVTLGLGYGFYSGGWAKNPTVNLSFMARLSPKTYIISENYIITIEDESPLVILSFGGRSLARRIGIDYGLFIPLYSDMDIFFAVPWIGITIPFHNAGKERQLLQDGF